MGRIRSLDAIRGAAALWVLLSHCLNSAEGLYSVTDAWFRFTPVRILAGARFPVIVFFVLSGFVLARQFLDGREVRYSAFIVRRVCRIYLPFAASVLFAWLLSLGLGTAAIPGASDNINSDWVGSGTLDALLRHLAMIGRREDTNLNGVVWSLVYEMRISLLFPVLVAVVLFSRFAVLGLAILSVAAHGWAVSWGQSPTFYTGDTVGLSVLLTVYFVVPFAIGIALARDADRIANLRPGAQAVAGAGAVVAFLVIQRLNWPLLQDGAFTLLAAGVILLALKGPQFDRWLNAAPLQWLGRVSYSLYLFHVTVLIALFRLCSPQVGLPLLAVAAVPLGLLAAEVANRLIEQPAERLGRALTRRAATARPAPVPGAALRS